MTGREAFGGQGGFWAGKARIWESIAQRSRRSQRGNGCSGRKLWVDRVAVGREMHTLDESIAQRSRRSQRGDLVHQDLHPLLWPLCDAFPIALPGGGHKRGLA
jgi:hypothetical protein